MEKQINNLVSGMEVTVNTITQKTEENMDSNLFLANSYRVLTNLTKVIGDVLKKWKKILMDRKVFCFFEEDNQKVQYQEGKAKSYIDTKRAFEWFVKKDKLVEFLDIVSISETALKDYPHVINESKIVTNDTTSGTIKVGKIQKKDREEMGKIIKMTEDYEKENK